MFQAALIILCNAAVGEYSKMINLPEGWRGHLWQERFFSYPLDRKYLYNAARYVETNPVRAGMVKRAEEYPWSSAKAHIRKEKDVLLSEYALAEEIGDWETYLSVCEEEGVIKRYESMHLPADPWVTTNSFPSLKG